jgi:hypothetical protein
MVAMMGAAVSGTAATGTSETTGVGIIEGTASKVGAERASGENEKEGADKLGPTELNGMTERLEPMGSTAFTWAKDDDGNDNATAMAAIRFMRPFYRMISTFIWDLRTRWA